jgi:hypothetical protein
MEGTQDHLQAVRPQEVAYEQQIRTAYQDSPHLFVTHSSDLLHLQVAQRLTGTTAYQCLVARSGFSKYDVVAEVRGAVISYGRLRQAVEEGRVERRRLPLLLYLNFDQQLLLSPKNIAKYLFTAPRPLPLAPAGNCYIENHFGSKLLVTASRDIAAGEELVLEEKSHSQSVYCYSGEEF